MSAQIFYRTVTALYFCDGTGKLCAVIVIVGQEGILVTAKRVNILMISLPFLKRTAVRKYIEYIIY